MRNAYSVHHLLHPILSPKLDKKRNLCQATFTNSLSSPSPCKKKEP